MDSWGERGGEGVRSHVVSACGTEVVVVVAPTDGHVARARTIARCRTLSQVVFV